MPPAPMAGPPYTVVLVGNRHRVVPSGRRATHSPSVLLDTANTKTNKPRNGSRTQRCQVHTNAQLLSKHTRTRNDQVQQEHDTPMHMQGSDSETRALSSWTLAYLQNGKQGHIVPQRAICAHVGGAVRVRVARCPT